MSENLIFTIDLRDQFTTSLSKFQSGLDRAIPKVDHLNSKLTRLEDKLGNGVHRGALKGTKALSRFEKGIDGFGNSISILTAGAGFAMGAFAADTIKVGSTFEEKMSGIQAITGTTDYQLQGLQGTIRKLGSSTQFSASQAASGADMLIRNGLTHKEVMNGALESTLQLAAATRTDLPTAADIATDAMQQFGKGTTDLPAVMDRIVGATKSAKFQITDFGGALAQGGGIAGSLGVSFEDFSASIAATASNFSSGSDAGTSYKTFLTSLVPRSKEAKREMDKLGLSFFDSSGNMKTMSGITETLRKGFAKLTPEQKNNAATTIFGTDAMRTALGLAKMSGKEFEALSKKLGNTSASETAAKMTDNYAGSVLRLKSGIQELQLSIWDEMKPALRGIVDDLTSTINSTGNWTTTLQSGADWFRENWPAIKDGFKAGGIAAGIMTTGVIALNAAMFANPVFLVTGGIAALSAGIGYLYAKSETARMILTGLWESMKTGFSNIWESGKLAIGGIIDLFTGLADGIRALVEGDFSAAGKSFKLAGKGIIDLTVGSTEMLNPLAIMDGTGSAFMNGMDKGKESFAQTEAARKGVHQKVREDQIKRTMMGMVEHTQTQQQKLLKQREKESIIGVTAADILKLRDDTSNSQDQGFSNDFAGNYTAPRLPDQTTSSSPEGGSKSVVINIEQIAPNLTIHTENVTEGAGRIKEIVVQALMDALNDSQLGLD